MNAESIYKIHRPVGASSALVFDSPHSGCDFPDDFGSALSVAQLRTAEDTFVQELYADAPAHGAHLLEALFPRSYIDQNRSSGDIDLELIDTAGFTLKRTRVSPALRARLAAALTLGVSGEIGARRLVAVDYACVAGWLDDSDLGSGFKWDGTGGISSMLFDLFGPFVHNPQRTLNLYGDLIGELQELAARREGGKIDPRAKEFWAREGRPRFKNFGGTSVAIMFTPALSQPVASYWRIEDKRTALLATLAK